MRIEVHHSTSYRYADPLLGGLQYLRLTPSNGPGQRVLAWKVSAPGHLWAWRDHHGNACHSFSVSGGPSELNLSAEGQVETIDTAGVLPLETGGLPVPAYLRPSPMTLPSPALIDLAEGQRAAMADDPLTGLHDLMTAIAQLVAYQEGETEVTTTADDALAKGRGVCQDHAHVFIACCRLLAIPARYVSGYLASSDKAPGRHSAGHAWAEAMIPALCWVSFDPANKVSAGANYLRLAVGYDYLDAGPLRGVRRGGGEEDMQVQIEIQVQD